MDKTKQREEFEAWAKLRRLSLSCGDCGYVFSSTEMAWRAWQAAQKAALASIEIELPAPTDEIIPGCRYYFNDDIVMTLEAKGLRVKS